MTNVNITYDEMRSAATQLRSQQETLTNTVDDMVELVNNLVESGFTTDTASSTYQDAVTQYAQETKTNVDLIEKLATFLEDTERPKNDLSKLDLPVTESRPIGTAQSDAGKGNPMDVDVKQL